MSVESLEIDLAGYGSQVDFTDLQEATQRLTTASDEQFQSLKSEKWFSRLFDMLTFSNKKGIRVAEQISNLAQAQTLLMELLIRLSARDEKVAALVEDSFERLEQLSRNDLLLARKLRRLEDRVTLGTKEEYELDSLSEREKLILAGVLTYAAQRLATPSEAQQEYASAILRRIDQDAHVLDPSKALPEIDSKTARKKLFLCLMEYIFLYDQSFSKLDDLQDLVECFDFGRRTLSETRERVQRAHALRGARGLIEKHGGYEEEPEEEVLLDIELSGVGVEDREARQFSDILLIGSDEEKSYVNETITIDTSLIKCNGRLRFHSCDILVSNPDAKIELGAEALLEFVSCTIRHEKTNGEYFIDGEGQVILSECSVYHDEMFVCCKQLIIKDSEALYKVSNNDEYRDWAKNYPLKCLDAEIQSCRIDLEDSSGYIDAHKYQIADSCFSSRSSVSDGAQESDSSSYLISCGSGFLGYFLVTGGLQDKKISDCKFENISCCIEAPWVVSGCSFKGCNLIFRTLHYGSSHDSQATVGKCVFINCGDIFRGGCYDCVECLFENCSSPIANEVYGVSFNACRFNNLTIADSEAAFSFFYREETKTSEIKDCIFDGVHFANDESRLATCSISNDGIVNKKAKGFIAYIRNSSLFGATGAEPAHAVDTHYLHSGVFKDSYEWGINLVDCRGIEGG